MDDEDGCVDCRQADRTVREDWEFADGVRLCCECYSERRRGQPSPQEYYIDWE